MALNATASVRQHAVSVKGLEGVWATLTGGVPSVDVSTAYNGGAKTPDLTLGRVTYSNVTVSRPYNNARDAAVLRFVGASLGTLWTTTVVDQDLDANDMTLGEPVVYTGCVPVSVTGPEFNTESSDPARIELEFQVQGRA